MADEQITQTITPLPDVAGRFDADFIETADKFLSALPKNAEELNTFIAQFNELLKFVNTASAAAIAAQNVMGAWDSSVEYKHPCTVFYNGRRYASLQDSLDKQPDTETDYWLLIDGEGSNLDADTVDGKQASDLANVDLSNVDDNTVLSKTENAINGELVKLSIAGTEIIKADDTYIKNQCTAWVNFDGTDGTIRDSYNIVSVTRNGTGDYTITFANSLTTTNYTICGGWLKSASTHTNYIVAGFKQEPTLSNFRIGITNGGTDNLVDMPNVFIQIFGGK